MKTLIATLALAFAGFTAHAAPAPTAGQLSFAKGAITADCLFMQGPQTPDESKMTVTWLDGADHSAIEPRGFAVELFMPDMGHGSAPTQIQRVLDKDGKTVPGVFEISNMYFVMSGKWQVKVTLDLGNGTKETQILDVDVPGSMVHHHH